MPEADFRDSAKANKFRAYLRQRKCEIEPAKGAGEVLRFRTPGLRHIGQVYVTQRGAVTMTGAAPTWWKLFETNGRWEDEVPPELAAVGHQATPEVSAAAMALAARKAITVADVMADARVTPRAALGALMDLERQGRLTRSSGRREKAITWTILA